MRWRSDESWLDDIDLYPSSVLFPFAVQRASAGLGRPTQQKRGPTRAARHAGSAGLSPERPMLCTIQRMLWNDDVHR
jgi:hypothetical protein